MKIAINPHYESKFEKDRAAWRHFNGSFENMDIPPFMWIQHIKQGHPYTTQHNGYRKQECFLYGQHLATDHDEGESFDELLSHPFIAKYAYAIHSTPSYTQDFPRLRVIYVLDEPIRNKDRYALLAQSLCHHFEHADKAAKDPCRFFYGHKDGIVQVLGNILSVEDAVKELVVTFRQQQKPIKPHVSNGNGSLKSQVNKILDAPDGAKWYALSSAAFVAGGFVGAGAISYTDAYNQLLEAIQQREIKSLRIATNAIETGLEKGSLFPLDIKDEWELMGVKL